MSEEQRKVSESSPGSTAMFNGPGRIPKTESYVWHQTMDITPSDFPYLQQLMEESFEEWMKESAGLQMVSKADWAVISSTGEWLVGDPMLQEYFSAGDDSTLKRALEIRAAAAGSSEDRLGGKIVCASPVFSRTHGDLFAVLISVSSAEIGKEQAQFMTEAAALMLRACFYRRFECIFVEDLAKIHSQAEREARRRSVLFQVVKRMHAQINVDGVLTEMLVSVLDLYPNVNVKLFMSQDHQSSHPLVRPLLLHHWQEKVYVRTFMEGALTICENRDQPQGLIEIGVPVGGKQGVYGVLHLVVKREEMEDMDLDLLGMMADAAGTAFENAKLYEQSNLMIHELRMINELTQQLNKSLQLADIYQFANEELRKILAAEYCCILSYNEELGGLEVMSCNAAWLTKEMFEKDYGLGGLVYHSKEPLILADYTEERPAVSKLMDTTGSNSTIATPLTVNGEIQGVILLTHRKKHYFSYDNYRLLQALTSHIGLAVGNASLHAEVRRMANRDMLTELYARHYLDEAIHECQSRDFCGSLIVVDIDQFKQVNDTFGHQRGDKILKQVSGIVRTSIRQSDIAARWGGEELAVYLPGLGIEQALQVAERIRLRVADETEPRVTVSCGISEWNWMHDRISVESLFYRADMALYEAKNSGRNRIVVEKTDTSEE
ncbi:diguanylate cyclase (GGDEF) domain-containing protein [Paenibacillus uliginis N3/975]|uniref:Diguanylate cyclase (GGDEF) domain-containing protein n=1 Tax=Paenibacillus uliginis N3/975 TaxID=1313296 RepID=A0A1X7HLT5_9BACL|nr:sensor domain-containing diguanylate cyclase [Paenibacillus uliginis]SMF87988.1 diguanylate cyclase (GGDEF) domain-containing protein [Paenibacillus uliginis N3/975]